MQEAIFHVSLIIKMENPQQIICGDLKKKQLMYLCPCLDWIRIIFQMGLTFCCFGSLKPIWTYTKWQLGRITFNWIKMKQHTNEPQYKMKYLHILKLKYKMPCVFFFAFIWNGICHLRRSINYDKFFRRFYCFCCCCCVAFVFFLCGII